MGPWGEEREEDEREREGEKGNVQRMGCVFVVEQSRAKPSSVNAARSE